MSQVVQATCPGCKAILRIPAAWLQQSFRCKHCSTVIHARAKPEREARAERPATPTAKPVVPVARPAVPVARPASAAPPAAKAAAPGSPFAFDEADADSPARRARRRGSRGLGLMVFFLLLLVAVGVAGVLAWPRIQELLGEAPSTEVASVNGGGAEEDDTPTHVDPAVVGGKTRLDTGRRPDGGGSGEVPRKPTTPVKGSGRPRPSTDLPSAAGAFPRRALVVSINNYLYANPINHGQPSVQARNVSTFLNHLNRGLRVPDDQVLELSDAALKNPRPTVDPVIRETISGFLANSRAQDRVLLFVIGHIVDLEGEAYLVPQDGDLEAKETLIPVAWLYGTLAACKARQKVLVVDTCRLDPARGQERPGSGPMSEKVDALLSAPPAGIQVWTACVKEQFSYEFSDGETNNGLFLDELFELLGQSGQGQIQKPTDPLPLTRLVDEMNRRLKTRLEPLGKVQTSRLSGTEAEEGADYDPSAPLPSSPQLARAPERPGGLLDVTHVKAILKDISFPPLKVSKEETALTAEALPPFSREAMLPYLAEDKAKTDLREQVLKARDFLNQISRSDVLRDSYSTRTAEMALKTQVMTHQQEAAKVFQQLQEAHDAVEAAGKAHRKEETKRWQANHDYLMARLKAQMAYLIEYQSLLGQLRKELPAHDPKVHNRWRLASHRDPQGGDRDAKRYASEARKLFDRIIKEYPETPWAIVARRDKASALGLEWQATK